MLTFLLAWLDVRALGGTMVFRLEDLDPERSWEHYADLMANDLLWLGLDWDEGWRPGSQTYRQGTRTQRYTAALDTLTARGMVYDCYCSRAERLAASAPHPGEPREAGCPCRTLSEQEVQKRLRMGRRAAKKLAVTDADIAFVDAHYGPQAAELQRGRDDFLIRRSDGVFAYQLAVSVDDLDMGITRVVRARDLLDSTPRQIWLMETLGGKAPEYAHAPAARRTGRAQALQARGRPEHGGSAAEIHTRAVDRQACKARGSASDGRAGDGNRTGGGLFLGQGPAHGHSDPGGFLIETHGGRIQTDAPILHAIIFPSAAAP